jgi:biopolymer transport protein ExbB
MRPLPPIAVLLLFALWPAFAHAAWWNEAWTTRTKVTVNTSATGVATQEAVANAVIPVRLHSGNFDFALAKPDGSDLRVIAADDKTPLRFSVERFDAVNELALIWVQLPNLLPGSAANTLHVYAGNVAATAEPAANVFEGNGYALVANFAEDEAAPAADSSGALRTQQPVPRQPNGLLGTSARLAGEAAVGWAADARLQVAADAPASVALWIRADDAQRGTLLQWGPLRVSLAAGQVVAEAARLRAAGGSIPPATWAHVAVNVGGGKLTLFVNGAQAAEALGATPALAAPLALGGANYAGLVDALQVSSVARSAEWHRVNVAAQGADGKLVTGVKEAPGEAAAGNGQSPGYMGILVKNLTIDAWVVIAILAVMFVVACWVMWSKTLSVRTIDRANRAFLQRFRTLKDDLLQLGESADHGKSSLFRLYRAGVGELKKRDVQPTSVGLSGASLDAVKAAVDADLVRENHHLNDRMVWLTIAISGGPFLGLLGTVVGVMITFAAIAAAGDVNVNAIAPGIAAALLATVAGLAVAIPALFGYNYLASRIKNISADMQIFVDEFITRVAEKHGAR